MARSQRSRVLDAFIEWYAEDWVDGDIPDIGELRRMAETVFTVAAEARVDLARPTPKPLHNLIHSAPEGQTFAVADTVSMFLRFLEETGRWHGSEAQLDECIDVAESAKDETPGVVSMAIDGLQELREVPGDVQTRAIDSTPFFTAVTGALDLIGTGRPITSTQALRRADVDPVLAMLGLSLDHSPAVKSRQKSATMWAHPIVRLWWSALETGRVISLLKTRAKPGEYADDWRSGAPSTRVKVASIVFASYLLAWVGDEGVGDDTIRSLSSIQILTHLALACQPDALSGLTEGDITVTLAEASSALGKREAMYSMLAGRRLESHFALLVRTGLVTRDLAAERFIVPEGLRPIVAQAIQLAHQILMASDGGQDASLGEPRASMALGTVLTLKIALVGLKPAVWRRVTVSADASLRHLHLVIQHVFGWSDSHLHQFGRDDWYTRGHRYQPAEMVEMSDDPFIEPEDDVAVGALLADRGDELFYVYDFGDDWRHIIRLEKAEKPATVSVPECIGGNGVAPEEDSSSLGDSAAAGTFDVARADRALAPLR